jgi:tetratricopeptide (TPR) repeat protein
MLLLAGRFEDAKARARRALENDPANIKAQILLGNALAGLKDFDGAINEVEEALKLDPDRVSTYASLGSLQLAKGNRKAAEDTFRRAVERQPSSVPARLALGNFYWTVGQFADAERLLREVAADSPENPQANRALANFLLSTKRAPEAERYLVALNKVDSSAGARLALADYYLSLDRPADALPLLKGIPNDARGSVYARIRLAAIDLRAGRVADAERLVDELLRANGSETEALLLKAGILVERHQIDEAAKYVQTAVESNPGSARAQFALGKLAVLRRRPEEARKAFTEAVRLNPRAAEAQTELARLHLARGSIDTGVDLAGRAVKNDPASADARLVLARAFIARKDLPRAQQILTELASTHPSSASVRTQLGVVLALKGERAAAIRQFEEALALDPDHLEATSELISLDLTERQFGRATGRALARVARTPRDSEALLLAGKTYRATGDAESAEQFMRRAIDADSGNLGAYESLGSLYLAARRLPEAQTEFEALASRQPFPVATLTMVGLLQQSRELTDAARETYEKVLQIDPNAAVAANNLAWIYVDTGKNLDLALQLAQTAKAGLPKNSEVTDTLGWIYYRKGLLTLALRELAETVSRDPGNPRYHYHLGVVYAANGNTALAKRSLETALRLNPNFDGAGEASRLLATL